VAEQSTFARRMMAQKLMAEKRDDPFSDSRFFAGKMRPSMDDIENPTRLSDMAGPAYGAAATGSLFVPGSGFADVFGGLANPSQPGEMLPSFGANVRQGNYLDAGLQTLGVAGDVLQAGSAFVPPLAVAGTMLKAPRAARVADAAMDAADAAKIDPNQATGAAMDAAQARYFETGKFEPPTADNPVSIVPPKPDEPGIIAFHGSGADFDEFRLEMIGTGEGAQAYGYGLYFTDSEDIARFYKDAVGGKNTYRIRQFDDIGQALKGKMPLTTDVINNIIDKKIKVSSLPKEAQSSVEEILKRKKIPTTKKMYKVGLAPKPDELLDYDAPLSQQPRVVQKQLENLVGDLLAGEPEAYDRFDFKALAAIRGESPTEGYSPTGDDILTDLQQFFAATSQEYGRIRADGAMKASEILNDFGIPGIRYATNDTRSKQFILKLDVRGKPYDIGTEPIYARNLDDAKRIEAEYKEKGFGVQIEDIRKSNYVIFDDKAVKILEKYGIVGPVAVTAAGAAAVNRGRNDNDNGGSILPDAGIM
jgi:hypothetical protein